MALSTAQVAAIELLMQAADPPPTWDDIEQRLEDLENTRAMKAGLYLGIAVWFPAAMPANPVLPSAEPE